MTPQISAAALPLLVPPTGQQTIDAFGCRFLLHLGAAETDGRFTLGTLTVPPGGGPPIHYHEEEDECFIPLAGRAEFFHNDAWTEVPIGTVVYLPRGSRHAFKNVGTEPLRMTLLLTPAGFESFFADSAEEFAKPGGPDIARIVEISARRGIYYPE